MGSPWLVEGDIYVVEELFDGIEPGRDLKRRSASFSLMQEKVQVEGTGRA